MSPGESERYSRQILFRPIGSEGQEKIRKARLAIVGCGALGSVSAELLARAGVGTLVLIDRDYVDTSNLQRQLLFDEFDAADERPKVVAAADRLHRINHDVAVEPHVADLTPSNAEELLANVDLIVDGTDNFETRYLLNDVSVKNFIPWIYGAAIGSYGITMPVWPERGPCFACVYPEPPAGPQATCDVNGVLASATTAVASLQVGMALHMIVGWDDFSPTLRSLDIWSGNSSTVQVGKEDPECSVCSSRSFRFLEGARTAPVSLCGRNAVQLHVTTRPVDLAELANRWEHLGQVRRNEFALRLDLAKFQLTVFPDGRAIVKGTTDVGVARSLYAQLIGN
jgi:molybdopterin-synthase adenylyltransferase